MNNRIGNSLYLTNEYLNNMVKKEEINGKIFLEQRTYYVYKNEEDLSMDKPCLITSDKKLFEKHKTIEHDEIK